MLKDIVDFHRDYHKISKYYHFGEIFTKEYLDFLETDIEEVFFSNLEDAIFDTDFSFFPVKNKEIDLDMMFSSKLFYHDNRNQIVENYVYGMYLMLQQEEAEDYVLSTNKFYSVSEFIEKAFGLKGFKIKWDGEGVNE